MASPLTPASFSTPQGTAGSVRNYLALVGLLYLLIGTFILFRRWTARKSRHFYIFCLASFVLYTFAYTGKLNLFDWTIYWLNVAAWVLQPALFLHFCLTFPERSAAASRAPLPGASALFARSLAGGDLMSWWR